MSTTPPAEPASETPKTKKFRPRHTESRLSQDAAARQGRVTHLAWTLLGGRDNAVAFLNTHDSTLGGRPLDLAVASEAGCAAVEQAIAERAAQG